MRRLVLYSDQRMPASQQVDQHLLHLLGTRAARIGYIASSSDPDRRYFRPTQHYYQQYHLELALYVELDVAYTPELLDALFACDAIHLSGGNSYYFLYWLQRRGLMERLRQYAEQQGVLVGVSAGAIVMTPHISSALLCGDEPYAPLMQEQGLDLVDFAFVPHLDDRGETHARLQAYADQQHRMVYGCHDGDGMVVVGAALTLVGKVVTVIPSRA